MKRLFFLSFIFAFTITNVFAKESVDDSDLFRKDEKAVFLNTEFLYWTASSGNNEYAFQYDRGVYDPGSYYYGLGKYISSKYGWNPGFRVAAGYFYAANTYQVVGQFAWIKTNNKQSATRKQPYDQPLCGTFPLYDLGMGQLTEAKSSTRLNHELGDLYAARVWFPNLHFRLRLFGGLTGVKIERKWDVAYTDVSSKIANVYNKWKFLGGGLRLGIDLDWFWSNYFYVSGKMSMAPFIGKYNYFGQITLHPTDSLHERFEYDQYRGVYHAQAYFGPSYQRAFCKSRFEIFLGYELNGWFNVHEKIINTRVAAANYLNSEEMPLINSSLFLLHGLTSRLTLDF